MQILRLFILSCSHIALSLRQVKSTNRPRPAGFSQKFSARFRKGHPLPCKLARGVRQAFGGSQNLPRGVRHVFVGSQKLPRGVRHVFGGSQKLPRQLRHVFGGSQKQRGECGTFSGVPETRPKFHFSAFSIQKLQRKTRFQDSALQYFYGKSSLKPKSVISVMMITTLVFVQMSLRFEGAMGFHCNRKTERQMTKRKFVCT